MERNGKKKLSRREFLKGAGAAAVGTAAVGIFGTSVFASEDAVTGASVVEEENTSRAGGSSGESSRGSGEVTPGGVTSDDRVWGYSGPGDWLGQAPDPGTLYISRVLDCDVAVIGLGHAGVQAVLGAAEKGARVIGVEKHSRDTHSWFGEDFGCWNSDLQVNQAGFGPYDLGEVVDEFVTRGGGRSNPEIVRLYVHNSGPTMDNMMAVCKEMGVDPRVYTYDNTRDGWLIIQANFDYDKWKSGADIYDCLRKDYPIWPGTKTWAASCQFMGEYNDHMVPGVAANSKLPLVNQACLDKCVRDYGTQLLYGTSGVVLCQDENKAVTGVIVQDDATGEYIQINTAKGVVMAGGDYAGNKEMSWALLNEYMERSERAGGSVDRFYSSGRDGSSVKMMCWAGGFVEPAPRGTMILGGGPTGPWGANAMLWLNCRGRRFTNEGNITAAQTATSRQPKGLGCLVTDKKWLKSVCASGLEHSGPNAGRPQYFLDMIDGMNAVEPGPQGGIVKSCIVAERMYEKVLRADTLEELARYIGYQEEDIPTFLQSIRHYNELCYAGADTDFGKDASAMIPVDEAPYYAVVTRFGSDEMVGPQMVTMSGVMTDHRLNVIDADRKPIRGLYACGNSLGGRYGTGYCTPSAGNSIGYAMTHGRLAGQFVCEE